MNIFWLDNDPQIAAQMLADIHVGSKNRGGKMIVESAQMLGNCYSLEQLLDAPYTKKVSHGNIHITIILVLHGYGSHYRIFVG